MLPELVRRANAGEQIVDDSPWEPDEKIFDEEKLDQLAEMICQAGDQPETRAAARSC